MIKHKSGDDARLVQPGVYAAHAVCGVPIYAKIEFKSGQNMTVGAAPHVECARCFPLTTASRGEAVTLPPEAHDGLGHDVYDEDGKVLGIVADTGMGKAMPPDKYKSLVISKSIVDDPSAGRLFVQNGLGKLIQE